MSIPSLVLIIEHPQVVQGTEDRGRTVVTKLDDDTDWFNFTYHLKLHSITLNNMVKFSNIGYQIVFHIKCNLTDEDAVIGTVYFRQLVGQAGLTMCHENFSASPILHQITRPSKQISLTLEPVMWDQDLSFFDRLQIQAVLYVYKGI